MRQRFAKQITLLTALAALFPMALFANEGAPEHPDYVLSEWDEKERLPPLLGGIETPADWEKRAEAIRKKWLDYIGGVPERVPARATVISETEEKDHLRQEIVYDTVHGDRITAFLLIPNEARENDLRYPAVLALHPTNAQGKSSVATAEGRENRRYGYELVSRGYIVLAPDSMTSGDRIFEESKIAFPGNAHFRTAPFYDKYPEWSAIGKHLVDHLQGLDFLAQHERVDPERIGAIGHSFGAYNAYFIAGVDSRIKAFVSSCGFSPFVGGRAGHWAVRNPPRYLHLPRLQADLEKDRIPFEFHEIAALAAPAAAFFYNGQRDHIFPHWRPIAEGMAQLQDLYAFLGTPERFTSILSSGGHDFPPEVREMSYHFLDKWLKPAE